MDIINSDQIILINATCTGANTNHAQIINSVQVNGIMYTSSSLLTRDPIATITNVVQLEMDILNHMLVIFLILHHLRENCAIFNTLSSK